MSNKLFLVLWIIAAAILFWLEREYIPDQHYLLDLVRAMMMACNLFWLKIYLEFIRPKI